ncbi:MAG: hypothetical protein NZM44_02940, partial [Candidatus Calescibacterium sp.]|nr:hypothetical protein [Candidatus Calescibacterium sp.]
REKGMWERIADFFSGDWSGVERITQPGGIHFYAEGAEGETRTDATKGQGRDTDLTDLYTYLSNTRFGPGGPTEFNLAELVEKMVDIVEEVSETHFSDNEIQNTNTAKVKRDTIEGPQFIDKNGDIGNTLIIRENDKNVDTLYYTPSK